MRPRAAIKKHGFCLHSRPQLSQHWCIALTISTVAFPKCSAIQCEQSLHCLIFSVFIFFLLGFLHLFFLDLYRLLLLFLRIGSGHWCWGFCCLLFLLGQQLQSPFPDTAQSLQPLQIRICELCAALGECGHSVVRPNPVRPQQRGRSRGIFGDQSCLRCQQGSHSTAVSCSGCNIKHGAATLVQSLRAASSDDSSTNRKFRGLV
mmetsp:Transcript_3571/g.8417  ORF Transcript_3571/g.8417 Transcript_3571/m.8417 type:complete len:204 (-) Transcript_3571:681-1292(-)